MTTSRKGGPSRPGSSRATSVVGDIRKRREKPYKTETRTELVKKKKLKLQTSYNKVLDGYTFLPVGTPDLAERCKELSRQRGLRVDVVNAKPHNTFAKDPLKVSHHIHRIGYHFKAEIVDQAREELGYIFHRGRFIKEADLQAQYQQSYIANVMRRNGLRMDETTKQETPTQVRAAIKELFPKIPDEDLEQIVEHAWKEGTHRVGTNATMELPRRVQLATIARIRHQYTDYDYLLKAFEWKDARKEVEPKCLEKLIEWRGENDAEDDNELEEIVRETIVIDDDDDEENNIIDLTSDGEADDEDSAAELGDTSDASIEFTHQLARDEDLRPESANELSKSFFRRSQPWPRRTEQQNNLAKQKIGEARRLHALRHAPPSGKASSANSVHLPVNGRGAAPNQVVVDGRLYLREMNRPQVHNVPTQIQHFDPQSSRHGVYSTLQGNIERMPPSPFARTRGNDTGLSPHAVPSIEPHEPVTDQQSQSQPLSQGVPLPTAGDYQPEKRRRLDYSPNHLQPVHAATDYRPTHQHHSYGHNPRTPPRVSEVIDLTTPERQSRSGNPSPMRGVQSALARYDGRGREEYPQPPPTFDNVRMHERPPVAPNLSSRLTIGQNYQMPLEPVPYDPRQPMLDLPEREPRYDVRVLNRERHQDQPPGVSYAAHPYPTGVSEYESTYPPQGGMQYHSRDAYPTSGHQEPRHRLVQVSALTPQPVHGAPAPVQQAPFGRGSTRSPAVPNPQTFQTSTYVQQPPPPQPQPVYGAPHPAQYYVPR